MVVGHVVDAARVPRERLVEGARPGEGGLRRRGGEGVSTVGGDESVTGTNARWQTRVRSGIISCATRRFASDKAICSNSKLVLFGSQE